MVTRFYKLNIGDKFHEGKSKGAGINKNIIQWIELVKIDKSSGKIVNVYGNYGKHLIGNIQRYSANSPAYKII
jgi:hypothetical protein